MDKEKILKIEQFLKDMNIKNYIINSDLSVDVKDNVDLRRKNLIEIPIKFNKVSGYFKCSNNALISLVGCPETVGTFFDCSNNKLVNLIGSPKNVGDYYCCENNELISLEGCPETINGYFRCENNKLESLKGGPKKIKNYFRCGKNKLTSLEHGPESIGAYFHSGLNKLELLNYLPKHIQSSIYIKLPHENKMKEITFDDFVYEYEKECAINLSNKLSKEIPQNPSIKPFKI